MADAPRVSLSDIFAARRRFGDSIRRTPLVESAQLSASAGGRVLLKLETLQVTNSFKARGALNAAAVFAERAGTNGTIVTASAGNHGRGLASAAQALGLRAIVFTPRNAPDVKRRAIEDLGAELQSGRRLSLRGERADGTSVRRKRRPDLHLAVQTTST